jgi:hypothetical protein
MDKTNQFSLMIDALTELAEEEQAHRTAPAPGLPTLRTVIADASPLPREALFLGLAEDGLPVLLNLYDPIPGPLLITGDQASGKTTLLQIIAKAVELMHLPSAVQYAVITQYPDEWVKFKNDGNKAGIYVTKDNNSQELLQSLATWAHNNKGDSQSVLLLIDDLEAVTKLDEQAQQNLRWLLLRGPSRRVWPIVTLNASRGKNMEEWLASFRTRLFGHIEDAQDANLLTSTSSHSLNDLTAGSQFSMREGSNWLNFWTPVFD